MCALGECGPARFARGPAELTELPRGGREPRLCKVFYPAVHMFAFTAHVQKPFGKYMQ